MNGADLIAAFKKQPVGFICGGLCLISGLLLYYRGDVREESQVAYDQKADESAKIEANVRSTVGLPEQTAAMQADAREMESRLMHVGQLAINQQYFYRLESETGVKLLDIRQSVLPSAKPGVKTNLYLGVPYNISIQGTYPQVLAFLRRLEHGRHFTRFNTVSFGKSSGTTEGTANSLTVALSIELLGVP